MWEFRHRWVELPQDAENFGKGLVAVALRILPLAECGAKLAQGDAGGAENWLPQRKRKTRTTKARKGLVHA